MGLAKEVKGGGVGGGSIGAVTRGWHLQISQLIICGHAMEVRGDLWNEADTPAFLSEAAQISGSGMTLSTRSKGKDQISSESATSRSLKTGE